MRVLGVVVVAVALWWLFGDGFGCSLGTDNEAELARACAVAKENKLRAFNDCHYRRIGGAGCGPVDIACVQQIGTICEAEVQHLGWEVIRACSPR